MFKKIVDGLEAIRIEAALLVSAVRIASDRLRALGEGTADHERLSALEGRIEQLQGQIDAGIIKAEALKATARAAEDRARGHQKRGEAAYELAQSLEGERDPFEVAAERFSQENGVPQADGDGGEIEGVPPVSSSVGDRATDVQIARNAKHGVTA